MTNPDKNFRLSKKSKTMIALLKHTTDTACAFKRMMIDAQVCEEIARRQSLKTKSDNKIKE